MTTHTLDRLPHLPYRVAIHDLSGYADTVVYAEDAPVVMVQDVATSGEAFDIAVEYAAEDCYVAVTGPDVGS